MLWKADIEVKVVFNIERLPKLERQQRLIKMIEQRPFITDEELKNEFHVSIQTIRLDRMELGIPELRERIKHMAVQAHDEVRSISPDEMIGEIIDLQLNKTGISLFEIKEEHVFLRTKIARGHHIFSQANSIAVAVIDDQLVLTASANIRFIRPVMLHEKCIAKAYTRSVSNSKKTVNIDVRSYVGDELVFEGQFLMVRSTELHDEGGTTYEDSH